VNAGVRPLTVPGPKVTVRGSPEAVPAGRYPCARRFRCFCFLTGLLGRNFAKIGFAAPLPTTMKEKSLFLRAAGAGDGGQADSRLSGDGGHTPLSRAAGGTAPVGFCNHSALK